MTLLLITPSMDCSHPLSCFLSITPVHSLNLASTDHRYPCIVITAKGQPDVATRMFLSRIAMELQIPVLGLVDSDPYGLKILSVYMSGSKNMSYDSASLTTPDIKWLGLRPSDLDKYDLPDQCRLDMTGVFVIVVFYE